MTKPDLDLYTDYLLSKFGATTAAGLSAMIEGEVSHDQVTRFLSAQQSTSKALWQSVRTQSNHVFRAIYATFKLQGLSLANKPNPFVLCRKLRINASRSAYAQLQVRRAAA